MVQEKARPKTTLPLGTSRAGAGSRPALPVEVWGSEPHVRDGWRSPMARLRWSWRSIRRRARSRSKFVIAHDCDRASIHDRRWSDYWRGAGISNALLEWMGFDAECQPITATLADYLLIHSPKNPDRCPAYGIALAAQSAWRQRRGRMRRHAGAPPSRVGRAAPWRQDRTHACDAGRDCGVGSKRASSGEEPCRYALTISATG
jgi:hypothetical protein